MDNCETDAMSIDSVLENDESIDGPVELKLSNRITEDLTLEASHKIFQYAKKEGHFKGRF
ncbi:unnamed protein product [Rhizopus microsporus]